MASKKNKWRTRGSLQFMRVTGRYHDGSLAKYDVLWIRTRKTPGTGRAVAYCTLAHPGEPFPGVKGGLGCDCYAEGPIKLGKALKAHINNQRRQRGLEY